MLQKYWAYRLEAERHFFPIIRSETKDIGNNQSLKPHRRDGFFKISIFIFSHTAECCVAFVHGEGKMNQTYMKEKIFRSEPCPSASHDLSMALIPHITAVNPVISWRSSVKMP